QLREPFAPEYLLEAMVGESGVGDCGLAEECTNPRLFTGIACRSELLLQLRVHCAIDPGHEEGSDRGDPFERTALLQSALESLQIGLHHPLVPFEREEQGDVDVDPLRKHRLDRG